jgi:hydroxyacylglutathione hydrolase
VLEYFIHKSIILRGGQIMVNENSEWFKVRGVAHKTWAINDKTQVASYLVEGEEKALLIDTGWGIGNLALKVQSITSLPIIVVFTHGHPDHVNGAFQFRDLYISTEDKSLLSSFYDKETRQQIIGGNLFKSYPTGFSKEKWINAEIKDVFTVQEGFIFDLGLRKLKVIATPGHTPGSICLLDEDGGLIFSGDTIQARPVLMNVQTALPLSIYLESLQHINSFRNKFSTILPSHGKTPINDTILDELLEGISDILAGKIVGTLQQTRFGDGLLCKFKTTGIIYDRNRL